MAILIRTTENSGLDRYSQELAKRMAVTVISTGRYELESDGYCLIESLKALNEPIHFTNQHFGRVSLATGLPFIVTVHDLERMCFPFSEEASATQNLKKDILAIQKSKMVIAVSENTRQDLMRCLDVPQEKIRVVYNGVDHDIFKPSGRRPLAYPYILYVGSERPRKNLARLLEAFAVVKQSGDYPALRLVKIGSPGRHSAYRQATLDKIKELGLNDDVVFIPYVTDPQLAEYYSAARMLVYPSLYEGFGLPVIEAMACGCPVITSNVSALPEVAGDAALLVDPLGVNQLVSGMIRLLTQKEFRDALVARGLKRSSDFSWSGTAKQTAALYPLIQ